MESPSPEQIIKARIERGLTQTKAGEVIHCQRITWAKWESGENKMHPAFWELFLLKTTK